MVLKSAAKTDCYGVPRGRNTNQSISFKAFRFSHKFFLMVVGPSMCGKRYFVKQMLEGDHIKYDNPWKQQSKHWLYGQYQDMFKDMRRNMGKDIYFKQGQPEFELDLSDIDPCYNNIVVPDDLMDMGVDSPIISKPGKHRLQGSYCCYKMHFRKESTIPV